MTEIAGFQFAAVDVFALNLPFAAYSLGEVGEPRALLAIVVALGDQLADFALGGFLVEIGLSQGGGSLQQGALALGQARLAGGQALLALLLFQTPLPVVAGQLLVLGG